MQLRGSAYSDRHEKSLRPYKEFAKRCIQGLASRFVRHDPNFEFRHSDGNSYCEVGNTHQRRTTTRIAQHVWSPCQKAEIIWSVFCPNSDCVHRRVLL